MASSVRPNLLWCFSEGRPVFLDLGSQRYFTLRASQIPIFTSLLEGCPVSGPNCVELGAVISDDPPDELDWRLKLRPPSEYPIAESSIESQSDQPAYSLLIPLAFLCHIVARVYLKQCRFSDIIRRLQTDKGNQREKAVQYPKWSVSRSAGTFAVTTKILKSQDRCLPTSLAMALFLAKLGHFPDLVIGVKMVPWGAHAWLQCGQTVLNDSPDRIREFTPILIV